MAEKLVKKFFNEIKNDHILIFGGAYSPLLTMFRWNRKDFYEGRYKTKPSSFLEIIENREASFVFNDTRYKNYGIEIFLNYLKGSKLIKKLKKSSEASIKDIEKIYNSVLKADLGKIPEKKLLNYIGEVVDLFNNLLASTIYSETFDKDGVAPFLNEADRKIMDKIWDKTTHPIFESFEIRRLKKIISEYENNRDSIENNVQYIYTDYFYPKNKSEISQILQGIVGGKKQLENSKKKIEKNRQEIEKNYADFKKWEKNLSERERLFVRYIQEVMYIRDWRRDSMSYAQLIVSKICEELLHRAGFKEKILDIAPYIVPQELKKGVKWLKANHKNLIKRKRGSVMFLSPSGKLEVALQNVKKYKKEVDLFELNQNDKVIDKLIGQIGSKGIVRGLVKVIMDASNSGNFKEGDVLVAGMTRVEYVPLMKKSAAIITNEGGITSHAAIVSRELKKPCIIGTKIATKVLKDGDFVEVDADKGVVKIIKRTRKKC